MKAERKAVLTFLILAVSGFLLSAYGYLLLGKLTVTTEEIVTVQPITVNVQPSSSGSDSYSNVITFDYTRGGFEGGEEVLIRCELLLNDTKIFQAFRSLAVEIQDPDRNLNITCLTLANPVKEFVATVPSPPSAKSYNVTVIWQSTDNPPSQVELNIDAKVVVIGTTLWLNGWTYRKRHEIICSPAESVTNYQIRFVVHYGSGTDNGENVYLNGKCQPDFDDLRFTTEDQKVLSYWIEEKVDGDYAVVWVKIPDIPESPGKTTIYLYYGNPTATTVSNIKATFVRGDDFNDGVLDPMWTEWDKRGRGVSVTEENGYVEIVNLGIFSEGGIYVDLPSTMSSLVVECKFMIPVRDTIEGFDVILQHAAETPPETYHDVYWDWPVSYTHLTLPTN